NNAGLTDQNWIAFLKYFEKTWIQTFTPTLRCNNRTNSEGILARTNNCIERYNRRIGENFQNAHLNIYAFIAVIINEEYYYAKLIIGIWAGGIAFPVNNITFE
ncbi:hypothetical protein MXB_850, partial [Myxobolus squamalis]